MRPLWEGTGRTVFFCALDCYAWILLKGGHQIGVGSIGVTVWLQASVPGFLANGVGESPTCTFSTS